MNVNRDLDLALYGVMLVGLGVLAHKLAPDFAYATLITGIVGGGLSGLCGLLGLRRRQRRIWPVGILVVLIAALLVQSIKAWLGVIKAGTDALKPVAMILTALLVLGTGQLANFLKADRGDE